MSHWGYCIGEMIDHAKTRSGSKLQISLKSLITTRPRQKKICTSLYDAFFTFKEPTFEFHSNCRRTSIKKM